MRSLSFLAVAVAALSSIACGAPPPEAGNAYVTEGLEVVEGAEGVASTDTFRLIPVAVDVRDEGCSVDGVRFGRCTLTRTPTTDVRGQALDVCELEVEDGGLYTWECDNGADAAAAVERYQGRYYHCPTGG